MSNIVNKNNKKINKMSLFYVITLIVIFVAILTTSIILIAKPFDYKEIKDLKETTATSFLKEKPKNSSNSYYVLIYQEDSYKSNIIKKSVLDYANYTKKDKEAKKIYILKYRDSLKDIISKELDGDFDNDVPMLLLIENNAVNTSSTKKTPSDINTLLDSLVNK